MGGVDVIEDSEGTDTLLVSGSMLSDPLGSVEYSLSNGVLKIASDGNYDPTGSEQGVIVNDASQIEKVLIATDENAADAMESQLFQIVAEGPPEPDPIFVGPEDWILKVWGNRELANGFYSTKPVHWNRFKVEQQGDNIVLNYKTPAKTTKLWQGPADSVTHFEFFGDKTLAVSDFVELPPPPALSPAEAMAEVIPWAINEGYMKEYYLSTNGIAIGSEDDHLLIGDWANIGLAGDQIPGPGPLEILQIF